MNFLPREDTMEALLNPKFVTNSVANMELLEPHKDQKVAMGKMFRSNSREYRYGRATSNIPASGSNAILSIFDFTAYPSSEANCLALRPMKAGDYGVFLMLFSGTSSAGSDNYNTLYNRPIYNLTVAEVDSAYTETPSSTFSIGDIARVGQTFTSSTYVPPSFTANTYSRFMYCVIDTQHTLEGIGCAPYQKCMLEYFTNFPDTPLHWPNDLVRTGTFLTVESTNALFDARVLKAVGYNLKRFGWVFLSEAHGDIDAAILQVTAPTDPLPDPTNLRRKNAKKT